MSSLLDTTFDFRTDTPPGKDPDALSPTLRRYHKLLWGRPLPGGHQFNLDDSHPIRISYLHHSSDLGEFCLSSDSIVPTFTRWTRMQSIVGQIPEVDNEAFRAIGYTIGAMMLWPMGSRGGERSINVERGFNQRIADRMDLTLECVRRYYSGEPSPMTRVLEANADFFRLFGDFQGFVSHYLLQDLVTDDFREVSFFLPFDDFTGRSTPGDLQSYMKYREATISFVNARNRRVLRLAETLTPVAEAAV